MPGPAIAKQGTCSQYILYSVSVYSIHGWAVFFLKNQSFCVIDTLMGCLFVFLLILKSTYCLLTVYSGCTDDVLTFNFFFAARRALPAVTDCGKSAVERWHSLYHAEFARGRRATSAEGTSSAG